VRPIFDLPLSAWGDQPRSLHSPGLDGGGPRPWRTCSMNEPAAHRGCRQPQVGVMAEVCARSAAALPPRVAKPSMSESFSPASAYGVQRRVGREAEICDVWGMTPSSVVSAGADHGQPGFLRMRSALRPGRNKGQGGWGVVQLLELDLELHVEFEALQAVCGQSDDVCSSSATPSSNSTTAMA